MILRQYNERLSRYFDAAMCFIHKSVLKLEREKELLIPISIAAVWQIVLHFATGLLFSLILALMCVHEKQEQQRVAVGPGNRQFMSIRQVSLRRGTWPAAAAAAAAISQCSD